MKYMLQVRFNGADITISKLPATEQQAIVRRIRGDQSAARRPGRQPAPASPHSNNRAHARRPNPGHRRARSRLDRRARRLLPLRRARPRRSHRARRPDPRNPTRRHHRDPARRRAIAPTPLRAPRARSSAHLIVTAKIERSRASTANTRNREFRPSLRGGVARRRVSDYLCRRG